VTSLGRVTGTIDTRGLAAEGMELADATVLNCWRPSLSGHVEMADGAAALPITDITCREIVPA
jgi:hypothetical protein